MNTGILIVAHSPLASALRQCVLHVFPDSAGVVAAYDMDADATLDEGLAGAKVAMAGGTQGVMQVATTAPQNQGRKKNDQDPDDHQQ